MAFFDFLKPENRFQPVWTPEEFEQVFKPVTDFLGGIASAVEKMQLDLNALIELIKALVPLTCIVPFLQKIADSMRDLDNITRDLDIQGPNLDKDAARAMARVMAVPYVGDVVKNEINLAWMDRYQRITGRGFPSALDQLHYFVSGGITPSTLISEVSARVPEFFLDNDVDTEPFNKGYQDAIKELRYHKPVPGSKRP